MKKLITLLVLSILFIVGCANEEIDIQQEHINMTEEKVIIDTTDDEETIVNAKDQPDETNDNENEAEKQANKTSSPLTVHYIDVGQGDAALLTFEDEKEEYVILYDTGDWQGDEVVPYVKNAGVDYIDIVIISHPHADHMGQLADVLAEIDVGEVWMTGNTASSGVYERAGEALLQSDADYDEPGAGDTFDIGPLTADVLHPSTNLTGDLNQDSLSILFTYGNIEFLFTGDAYVEQENAMLSRTEHLSADFLQLGHHGSKTSSGENFLTTVDPTYAIYSAGIGNSYGHPHQEVLDRLQSLNTEVYGTDTHGTIIVTTDGNDAEITTEKSGTVTAGIKQKKANNNNNKTSTKKSDSSKKQAPSSDCIDINQASQEQLQEIIHLGDKRATDAVEMRPFDSIEDLQRINGIGPARIDDIIAEQKACVGGK